MKLEELPITSAHSSVIFTRVTSEMSRLRGAMEVTMKRNVEVCGKPILNRTSENRYLALRSCRNVVNVIHEKFNVRHSPRKSDHISNRSVAFLNSQEIFVATKTGMSRVYSRVYSLSRKIEQRYRSSACGRGSVQSPHQKPSDPNYRRGGWVPSSLDTRGA